MDALQAALRSLTSLNSLSTAGELLAELRKTEDAIDRLQEIKTQHEHVLDQEISKILLALPKLQGALNGLISLQAVRDQYNSEHIERSILQSTSRPPRFDQKVRTYREQLPRVLAEFLTYMNKISDYDENLFQESVTWYYQLLCLMNELKLAALGLEIEAFIAITTQDWDEELDNISTIPNVSAALDAATMKFISLLKIHIQKLLYNNRTLDPATVNTCIVRGMYEYLVECTINKSQSYFEIHSELPLCVNASDIRECRASFNEYLNLPLPPRRSLIEDGEQAVSPDSGYSITKRLLKSAKQQLTACLPLFLVSSVHNNTLTVDELTAIVAEDQPNRKQLNAAHLTFINVYHISLCHIALINQRITQNRAQVIKSHEDIPCIIKSFCANDKFYVIPTVPYLAVNEMRSYVDNDISLSGLLTRFHVGVLKLFLEGAHVDLSQTDDVEAALNKDFLQEDGSTVQKIITAHNEKVWNSCNSIRSSVCNHSCVPGISQLWKNAILDSKTLDDSIDLEFRHEPPFAQAASSFFDCTRIVVRLIHSIDQCVNGELALYLNTAFLKGLTNSNIELGKDSIKVTAIDNVFDDIWHLIRALALPSDMEPDSSENYVRNFMTITRLFKHRRILIVLELFITAYYPTLHTMSDRGAAIFSKLVSTSPGTFRDAFMRFNEEGLIELVKQPKRRSFINLQFKKQALPSRESDLDTVINSCYLLPFAVYSIRRVLNFLSTVKGFIAHCEANDALYLTLYEDEFLKIDPDNEHVLRAHLDSKLFTKDYTELHAYAHNKFTELYEARITSFANALLDTKNISDLISNSLQSEFEELIPVLAAAIDVGVSHDVTLKLIELTTNQLIQHIIQTVVTGDMHIEPLLEANNMLGNICSRITDHAFPDLLNSATNAIKALSTIATFIVTPESRILYFVERHINMSWNITKEEFDIILRSKSIASVDVINAVNQTVELSNVFTKL